MLGATNSPTSRFQDELHRPIRRKSKRTRIYSALKAVRAIRRQSKRFGYPTNRSWVEIGHLQNEIFRILFDLRVLTSHYPSNSQGSLVVGDHHHPAGERSFLVVQSYNLLVLTGVSNHDLAPFNIPSIKRMQWIATLVQNVIGHIHHVVNGPQAN